MPTKLPADDAEPFIRKLEEAQQAGDADFIEANMPRLEALIRKLQDRSFAVARMALRARQVRDRHEPAAEKRLRP
jgi:hypothetical protein